jgi:predicted DNA-binding transcriptional regulator YafY
MAGTRRDGVETALLMLEILKRIPRNSDVTATQLKEQLAAEGMERDLRSIQRHLQTLCDHFGIDCNTRSKPYSYRWKNAPQGIVMSALSPQESLLLKLAQDHLRSLLPPKLEKTMAGFFKQAERNLGPGGEFQQERDWLRKVRIVPTSQPLLPPEVRPDVFEAVTDALFQNHYLDVVYRNASGNTVKNKVMPLGIAQQGPRMYLVCRFDGYDDERTLALHRFVSAQASTLGFEYPKDFDLATYDAEGRFAYGQGTQMRLSFRISKEAGLHLTETPLSKDQTVKEHEDCYAITATVVRSLLLEQWIRGFGDEIWSVRRTVIRHGRAPRRSGCALST